MTTDKQKRARELSNERKRLIVQLRTYMDSLCESHDHRNVTKMNATLDRMLHILVALRDPSVNDVKRLDVLSVLYGARLLEEAVVSHGDNNAVYIQGDFDLDKLVRAVVWLREGEVVELAEIKGG